MKKYIIALSIVLVGCTDNYIENTYIGEVNGQTITLVHVQGDEYRPQKAEDCSLTSVGCTIKKHLIGNLRKL